MGMTTEKKVARRKLGLLKLVGERSNVSKTKTMCNPSSLIATLFQISPSPCAAG